MSVSTPVSEISLRHSDDLEQGRILLAGDLQDDPFAHLESAASRAHAQQLHHWQVLNRQVDDNVRFSLATQADDIAGSDTLIYYWPKNKPEAQLQLMNILSLSPVGTDIFVVGENCSDVRSVEQMLVEYASLNKVDSARRRGLYRGRLEKQPVFDVEKHRDEYQTENLTVKTLPGVFSHDGLSVGGQLLPSMLAPRIKDKVLDVGCGAGVLSVALTSHSPKVRLTLCDINAATVEASRVTLVANDIGGDVITNSAFSGVTDRLDTTISNPPLHDSVQTSLDAAQTSICGVVRHLNNDGELRIVANAFLPYPKILDEVFGFHEAIAQTGYFRAYCIVTTCQAKKTWRLQVR